MTAAEHLSAAELREIGLFGALPDAVLDQWAGRLSELRLGPGQVVFDEGDSACDMFVVIEGEVELSKRARTGGAQRIRLLKAGNWFGEMSLLDVQARPHSATVLTPCRLLRVTSADLDALYRQDLKSYALFVLNIARELSRRLRVAEAIA